MTDPKGPKDIDPLGRFTDWRGVHTVYPIYLRKEEALILRGLLTDVIDVLGDEPAEDGRVATAHKIVAEIDRRLA